MAKFNPHAWQLLPCPTCVRLSTHSEVLFHLPTKHQHFHHGWSCQVCGTTTSTAGVVFIPMNERTAGVLIASAEPHRKPRSIDLPFGNK